MLSSSSFFSSSFFHSFSHFPFLPACTDHGSQVRQFWSLVTLKLYGNRSSPYRGVWKRLARHLTQGPRLQTCHLRSTYDRWASFLDFHCVGFGRIKRPFPPSSLGGGGRAVIMKFGSSGIE
jgi:hypothetical protein